jgi:hypothetical protein
VITVATNYGVNERSCSISHALSIFGHTFSISSSSNDDKKIIIFIIFLFDNSSYPEKQRAFSLIRSCYNTPSIFVACLIHVLHNNK